MNLFFPKPSIMGKGIKSKSNKSFLGSKRMKSNTKRFWVIRHLIVTHRRHYGGDTFVWWKKLWRIVKFCDFHRLFPLNMVTIISFLKPPLVGSDSVSWEYHSLFMLVATPDWKVVDCGVWTNNTWDWKLQQLLPVTSSEDVERLQELPEILFVFQQFEVGSMSLFGGKCIQICG